jgi:hypothetical protein
LKKEAKTFATWLSRQAGSERLQNKRFLVLFFQIRTASFLNKALTARHLLKHGTRHPVSRKTRLHASLVRNRAIAM